MRKKIQILFALLFNLRPPSLSSPIYQGPIKHICCPGLNCHSCPLATTACPIGSLQDILSTFREGLSHGRFSVGLYILGLLSMVGAVFGRMICGWVCPFGLFQEALYKIPTKKVNYIPNALNYVKYVILALFVLILPIAALDRSGYGLPWFCRCICPAGTLEAGIPQVLLNPYLKKAISSVFFLKLAILALFLVWSILTSRPFCRTTCPLGAIYSFFNKISIFRLVHIEENCTGCGECYRGCPMGVKFFESPNDLNCIRCLKCMNELCKYGAISYELVGIRSPASKYMSSR